MNFFRMPMICQADGMSPELATIAGRIVYSCYLVGVIIMVSSSSLTFLFAENCVIGQASSDLLAQSFKSRAGLKASDAMLPLL